jgi:hypothetical protein
MSEVDDAFDEERDRSICRFDGPTVGDSASSSERSRDMDALQEEATEEDLDTCLIGGGGESLENKSNGSIFPDAV